MDFLLGKKCYDIVTTGYAHAQGKPCIVCPNGDLLQRVDLVPRGRVRAAILRRSPFALSTTCAPPRLIDMVFPQAASSRIPPRPYPRIVK
jgi:hypothetical protein